MSAAQWLKTPASRVAFGALVISLALLGWTLMRAFRPAPMPPAPPASVASLESIRHQEPRPVADVQAAVDNDLFSSDRTSPGGSYRMPGDPDPSEKTADPLKPLVLGTAVATDGHNFATVQMSGDQRPTLVHVGDKIGEWVVRAIERGKVTFVSVGGVRADVAAPKPGTENEDFNETNTFVGDRRGVRGARGRFGAARPTRAAGPPTVD